MKTNISAAAAIAALSLFCTTSSATAQDFEFSLYSGWQTSPHSRINGDYPGTGEDIDALIGWEGRSFEMPIYYGIRGTWWRTDRLGFGAEFTHTKVYAPDDDKDDAGFDRLEFTDGLNIVTANALYRWPDRFNSLTPYVGGGVGLSLPHVDVDSSNGFDTYELQIGGPAMRLMAGASYDITERVSLFGEYQFTASHNEVELEGDGSIESNIKTNAVNFGLTLKF
ncbi:lipid A oxidase (Involved in formation of 2-aminogluconate) protein [Roseivivax halodurans JCM 10272]|uniref:Lipid A oxidase (Involved in formation of 2-aminogluconate) protein n=1 Tax=Roseivivax halodurans JCM 10272 TaxID=1449350 RepID=X7EH20_9RHOB|nr:outer membrane beta-barrel protein [Roseivivax halodurans]ETX15237.1 lipid A oxidase (Involved in formation of 2-aminogluconate) protein [Roseivivax halodurans JCM 10272]